LSRGKVVDLAESYAESGFLCSESVLLSLCDHLQISSDLVPRIATGFGAGIGGQGLVCGAISGAVIALGIKFGRDQPEKKGYKPYWFAAEFLKRFRRDWRCWTCHELTGCNLTTDAGRKKYDDNKLWETRCRKLIATASGIAYDIIHSTR
jgi:C_GCAxxG_C_C family probable redox protein